MKGKEESSQREPHKNGKAADKHKYTRLSVPTENNATRNKMDRIRALFKNYLLNKKTKGDASRGSSQPGGMEKTMDSGGEKDGKQNESLPLERYSYYHGCLTRMDAEEILMSAPVGHFLVRASKRVKESFAVVVSIRTQTGTAHYQIPVDDAGKFYFNEFSFDTVHELLLFHWKHRVPISLLNDVEVYLIKAVDRPEWLFDDNEVILEPKPLGEGNFGAVYRGAVMVAGRKIQLAVKTLKNPDDKIGREELLREARIVRKLRFPSIVWCVGITVSSEATMVLLEFVNGGSMENYLRKNKLSPAVKVKLLVSCAKAVEFIHKNDIIHRDLAARNCLLLLVNDQPEMVKLCDFGLSQEKVKEYRLTQVQQIPVRWSAIECLTDKVWTQKSDVWSFGVVIYEFFSNGSVPYFELEPFDGTILTNYLKSGNTLSASKDMPQDVVRLMKSTLNLNANSRPSMSEVVNSLQDAQKALLKG